MPNPLDWSDPSTDWGDSDTDWGNPQRPIVSVVMDPGFGSSPLSVEFDITIDARDSTVESWTLDFGDGDDTGAAGNPSGETPTHIYDGGTFHPTLTLNLDDSDDVTYALTTLIVDAAAFDGSASFTADAHVGIAPVTVSFTVTADRGSDPAGGNVFFLDPGEGSPIALTGDPSGQTVTHEYTTAGTYAVNVTMEGDNFTGTVAQ